jgi:long-chain acyl-CoA synthetase
MSDPLAVLPLALAAGGGRVDGYDAAQLVSAGVTLLQRSATLVRALAGRRAALLLPTSPQFFVGLAASEGRGAVLINPLAAPLEIAYQLRDANVGAVFTVASLAAHLPGDVVHVLLDDAPRSARVLAGGASSDVDLGSHFGLHLEGERDVAGRDEEAAVVYTSAMAGRPLGAIVTHRNLLANARSTIEASAMTPLDHALAVLPFAHLFGLTVTGTAPLLRGARVTTMARFSPGAAIDTIRGEGVTLFGGVPAVFAGILTALQRKGARLDAPSLRLCICGGAELPVALQDAWFDATGVELRQGYGLTEAGPVCLFNHVGHPNRRGTLGVPFPGVEVELRDPVTNVPKPHGAEGEICVRGDNVFAGYVGGAPDGLTLRGGWLQTGDLGVGNADGTVSFRGLCKPMFTRNGFNIYPREIEMAIGELPGVRAVHVRAIPNPARENDVGVEVEGDVTEAQVKAWCDRRLSAYKVPSEIVVVR